MLRFCFLKIMNTSSNSNVDLVLKTMCIIIVKYFLLGFFIVSLIWNSSSYQYSAKYNARGNNTLLRLRRQLPEEDTNEELCSTLAHPTNGRWFYLNTLEPAVPLQKVPVNTTIGFNCSSGYLVSSNSKDTEFLTCRDGKWNLTSIPVCNKLCPPLYNTSVTTVTCKNKDTYLTVACDKATNGTLLTYECATYYEPSSPSQNDLICFDGIWDYLVLPLCIPACGKKILEAIPLVVGGQQSKRGKYPWVAALYSSKETDPYFKNICGGTLLTLDIVLTAAHCVTKQSDGSVYKTKYYRISAGKYFNGYNDSRDNDTAKYSRVQLIMAHPEYRGERQHFRFDIALLKIQTPFVLSNYIQPACYRDLRKYFPEASAVGSTGSVAGWGYTTSKGEPSEILKEVSLPLRDRAKCSTDFDQDWADQYFTNEKLCAGYLNQNTSVCKGDSGGGLVLQQPDNMRYYVYGIVSLAFAFMEDNQKHCDVQKSALFTKVDFYSEWLQNTITQLSCDKCQNSTLDLSTESCDFCLCFQKFCPASSGTITSKFSGPGCVTPAQPTNGLWVYFHNNLRDFAGQNVPERTVLYFKCHKDYYLSTSNQFVLCLENGWSVNMMPECKNLCTPVENTASTSYKCFNKDGLTISCDEPTTGTYLTVECSPPYYNYVRISRIYCVDGTWDSKIPQCRSECGRKPISAEPLIAYGDDGSEVISDPWAVLIFSRKHSQKFEYICTGTLLKDDIVITAGHCVTRANGLPDNTTYYRVGGGKFYNVYMDSRDTHAQYSEVEQISVHSDYKGAAGVFQNDLAILKLKPNFEINSFLIPVCFEDLNSFSFKDGSPGTVTGWGYTNYGEMTAVPKEVTVSLLDFSTCYNSFNDSWALKYVTRNKICAGYTNQQPAICRGDSGAGLIMKHSDSGRYFIRGVAGISDIDSNSNCPKNGVIVFTDILSHFTWIREQVSLLHRTEK